MKQMQLTVSNVNVIIDDKYVNTNVVDVEEILKRVSHIVSTSYHKRKRVGKVK